MREVVSVSPKLLAQQRGAQVGFPYTVPKADLRVSPAYHQTNQWLRAYVELLNSRDPKIMSSLNAAGGSMLLATNYYFGSLITNQFLFGSLLVQLMVGNVAVFASWLLKGLLVSFFLSVIKREWRLSECLAADACANVVMCPILFVALIFGGTPLGYYFFGGAIFAQMALASLNLRLLAGVSWPLAIGCTMTPFLLAVSIADRLR